ncbi:Hypothetical predicted protein [Cloeon dipterum]|uniref:Uncharacterized protein n=1 Tax=Cloeon dipterum TaxID=197152 RepID=A0A8S1C9U2_9INSE|nr:Hypothetical predicted protein [Cloeon dipterum]
MSASSLVERTAQVPLPSMPQQYQHMQGVKLEPQEVGAALAYPNMSPQRQNVSHSPQPAMPLLQQPFNAAHQMPQLFVAPQPQERFSPNISFNLNAQTFPSTSQATFGQPQAQYVQAGGILFNSQQQAQQALLNNLSAAATAAGPSTVVIADLDKQNFFDENISENLSGQLRLCGINSNDPGEPISVENMSTDSFCKNYL